MAPRSTISVNACRTAGSDSSGWVVFALDRGGAVVHGGAAGGPRVPEAHAARGHGGEDEEDE